jgi:hypothetical protein
MCAEQDPLDCHRCLLVTRALAQRGMEPRHILPDGQIVSQTEIEVRLLQLSGRAGDDLFASREDRLAAAYRERARKVAYAEGVPARTRLGARSSRRAGLTSAQQKARPRRVAAG